MKTLRKSLPGASKDTHSHRPVISTPVPLPSVSKPPSSILPPSKVIRAVSAYRPQAPQELSFQKGDFFYVLNDDGGQWYEAHNPVTGARGLVPRNMFEEFNKSANPMHTTFNAPMSPPLKPMNTISIQSPAPPRGTKMQVYYAIVQHDFVAERQDELDAKRGEAITVVAQSNREWFVAKPIGKLGRPGLIPVAFVQIHDPMTGQPIDDVEELIDSGVLPKVEEWKRAMITYKQNSITLGVIESPTSTPSPHMPNSSEASIQVEGPTPTKPTYPASGLAMPSDCLPDGILLSAEVVSFHHEMDEYWFRVDAVFQPYGSADENLPLAKRLILFRAYTDFYDFQVSLLDTFPQEAGRLPPHHRVLPYMPGPAEEVDDALTASRRDELDAYIHSLCDLSKDGYRYILEHIVIRQFLALKPGDVENVVKPRVDDLEALPPSVGQGHDRTEGLQESFKKSRGHSNGHAKNDASEYESEGYAPLSKVPPKSGKGERRPSQESATRLHSQLQSNRQRTESTTSFFPASSYVHSRSRSISPQQFDGPGNDSTYQSNYATVQHSNYQSSSHTHVPKPSTSSSRTTSSRSRVQPMAVTNINSPPISAANPQTAFVKIKIFNSTSDDLIAIRVHPRVTHADLMDKVNARLGNGVSVLKFRDSMNSFVGVASDEDLRVWMETADKHVLYAE